MPARAILSKFRDFLLCLFSSVTSLCCWLHANVGRKGRVIVVGYLSRIGTILNRMGRFRRIRSKKDVIRLIAVIVIFACFFVTMNILSDYRNRLYNYEQLRFLIPEIKANNINCSKLFEDDAAEQARALQTKKLDTGSTLPENYFSNIRCDHFIRERGYITSPMTVEEQEFPLAFTIMVFRDLGQMERLLRAIYRPQNAYCIHADKKSSKQFREGLKRIVSCFPNVILSSRSVNVKWGFWTNLECDLICMEDLVKRFPNWKYLINLTGQEFPLRTNLELVRILKAFNGANNIERSIEGLEAYRKPWIKSKYKFQWIKGGVQIAAVRGFIEYIFRSDISRDIMRILLNVTHPDETFFSTLNHNPHLGAPGAYLGDERTDDIAYRFVVKLRNWADGIYSFPCKSEKRKRDVCIWGVKDLPFLNSRHDLFINKLYWNFQPYALDCLEERIFTNSMRDYSGAIPPLNIEFYRKLSFVRNHQ